jgi:AcrR family transcriptional regulator
MYEMPSRSGQSSSEARAERERARAEERAARTAEKVELATERAAEQVERAAEQAEQKLERARQQVERGRDKAGEMLIWFREEPTSRRPSHSRADIARAAIEIADSDGFDAVSMRRVAQKLGAGTMTLYHYVRNKDELVSLMSDEIMAEVLVPEGELASDWRTALTQIAHRSHDAFDRHRWIFERFGDGRPGPNGMRHFEQSLAAVASLDIGREEVFELIGLVDDYVFGYSLREAQELEEHERGWPAEVVEFLQREIDSGDYPLIAEFFGNDAEAGVAEVLALFAVEGRFDRGLNRLLDGIEANLPSAKH